jgi:ribonuclease E
VVLIPNIHLETPNYNITRLRHDDVKLGEIQTSYQMVENPAPEISLPSAAQEAKPARQQAAVRGITPPQPAPIRERETHHELEQLSFLDRIFSWFKQMGVAEKPARPEQIKTGPQRTERVRGRRERGRDIEHEKTPRSGQRGRDDRGEHGIEAANASNPGKDAAPQRGERADTKLQSERSNQKKHSRPPREEKIRTELKTPRLEEQPVAEEASQQGEDGGRRRRRGGRQRDRGDRTERAAHENKQSTVADSHTQHTADQATREQSLVPETLPASAQEASALILTLPPLQGTETPLESSDSLHPESQHADENVAVVAEPAAAVPATALPALVAPEPEAEQDKEQAVHEPDHEPIEEPAAVSPPASITTTGERSPDEIEIEIEIGIEIAETNNGIAPAKIEAGVPVSEPQQAQLPQRSNVVEPLNLVASGLIMVETQPEKIKPAEADNGAGESSPPQRRRKRTPPSPVVNQDEPLVQVETHK